MSIFIYKYIKLYIILYNLIQLDIKYFFPEKQWNQNAIKYNCYKHLLYFSFH